MTTDYKDSQKDQINKDIYRYSGRSLTSGGDKSPLVKFIGTGRDWDVKPSRFEGQSPNIIFSFEKLEVIETESEWPGNTAELEIKHSGAQRSIYGFLVGDQCKALNVKQSEHSLDLFIGKTWLLRREKYNWGKIPNSQTADENGDTWGDIWRCELYQGGTTATADTTVITPKDVATVSEVLGSQPTTAKTAEELSLELLNGKTKADWIALVVQNEVIRSDATMLPAIMNDNWLAGLIASGKVQLGADGIYTVTS